MALVTEMRKQLSRYLEGKLTIQAFQEWFDTALDGPERDEAGGRLGTMVEWAFHHFEQGLLSQDGLQKKLHRLAAETSGSPEVCIAESPLPTQDERRLLAASSGSNVTGNNSSATLFQQLSSGSVKSLPRFHALSAEHCA
jgi:hypothetical protein